MNDLAWVYSSCAGDITKARPILVTLDFRTVFTAIRVAIDTLKAYAKPRIQQAAYRAVCCFQGFDISH
jgi:hypothetical protein